MKVVLRDGPATVVLDGRLEDVAAALLGDAGPLVAEQVGGAVARIEAEARARWPVGRRRGNDRRPHSRDLLDFGVEVSADEIRGYASSPAPHTVYIRTWQQGLEGRNPWQELLRKPGLTATGEIAEAFEDAAVARVERVG